jgi:hypothetical protein
MVGLPVTQLTMLFSLRFSAHIRVLWYPILLRNSVLKVILFHEYLSDLVYGPRKYSLPVLYHILSAGTIQKAKFARPMDKIPKEKQRYWPVRFATHLGSGGRGWRDLDQSSKTFRSDK